MSRKEKNSKSGIVVSASNRRLKVRSRISIVTMLSVLAVAIVIAGTVFVVHKLSNNNADSNKQGASNHPAKTLTTADRADYLATNGEYAAAQQILSDELAKTRDKQAQANIYMQQAAIALNAKNYSDAMGYAQKAEALVASTGTASLIGLVAQSSGDKTTARAYYQKAIDRLDKNSHTYKRDLNEYQTDLQAVSS